MSIKGYPTQEKDDRLKAQFATVEPVRELQYGLSVVAHQFMQVIGADAVEASSTTSVINATGHAALKGDVISFTSGALDKIEARVNDVTANTIELAETLSVAPSAADTFNILRHKVPTVDASGALPIIAGPLLFVRNGSNQAVVEDTAVPGNNIPLPVKLTGITGDVTVTAQNLNVQTSHTGASPDSMQIGDGTNLLGITASNEAKVSVTQPLPAGTNNIGDVDVLSQPARSHTTDSIRIGDGAELVNVTALNQLEVAVTAALPSGTNNIGDVDVLSQPARSHVTDSIRIGDGTDLVNVTALNQLEVALTASLPSGTNNIGDVDVLSQPARSHTTDSIRIGDGTDLVNVTALNQLEVALTASLPAGTNNIGDVDVLSQPARSHTTDSIRIGDGTDLVNVTALNQLEVAVTASLPAGTNNIGDVDVLSQPARSHTTDSIRIGDGTDLVNVTSSNQLEVAITNTNTSGSQVTATVAGVAATETAPANAVGFLLQASSANAGNLRYRIGGAATAAVGQQLEPGRDTGYLPVAANISIISESGTNEYQLQWIIR